MMREENVPTYRSMVEKMVLSFFGFFLLKKPINLERSIFVFNDFLDINFALKPYGYYFFITILFSSYMSLHSL